MPLRNDQPFEKKKKKKKKRADDPQHPPRPREIDQVDARRLHPHDRPTAAGHRIRYLAFDQHLQAAVAVVLRSSHDQPFDLSTADPMMPALLRSTAGMIGVLS